MTPKEVNDKNAEEYVRAMLTGEVSMQEFLPVLLESRSLQEYICALIPEAAKNCPTHPLWTKVNYEVMRSLNFDVYRLVLREHNYCKRRQDSIGEHYNIFSDILPFYRYLCPDLPYTTIYEEMTDFSLEEIGEYFEGPEVTKFMNALVRELVSVRPKSTRKKLVKERLRALYHLEDGKRPYWIQGGEWPAGAHSPMKFLESHKIADGKVFSFVDVDTGCTREIIQYY